MTQLMFLRRAIIIKMYSPLAGIDEMVEHVRIKSFPGTLKIKIDHQQRYNFEKENIDNFKEN